MSEKEKTCLQIACFLSLHHINLRNTINPHILEARKYLRKPDLYQLICRLINQLMN